MKPMMKCLSSVAYGGVDVHYKFSNLTLRDAAGKVVQRRRLEHGDRAVLRQELRQLPPGTELAMEASFGWPWLSDELAAAGLDVKLSNCLKVEQMRKARGQVKTNSKDADLLSLLPAEADNWWQVWLPPPEVRDKREYLRYRSSLVKLQTQTKNRIQAHFHRLGVFHDFADLFGTQGRRFLLQICAGGRHGPTNEPIPEGALAALSGQVRILLGLRQELAEIEAELRRQLEHSELSRRLKTIPGFGLILSHLLAAEIGRIERFAGHKALASYCGLAPRSHDSGEMNAGQAPKGRHLGQHCQRTLKWAFIEAAHGAVRKGGRWREMFDRVTNGGTRDRQRGYIKVARELVKVVYVVWSRGVDYCHQPGVRPGSANDRRQQSSASQRSGNNQQRRAGHQNRGSCQQSAASQQQQARSVVGQPFHPMVTSPLGR
jgi:transposase